VQNGLNNLIITFPCSYEQGVNEYLTTQTGILIYALHLCSVKEKHKIYDRNEGKA